MDKEPEDQCSSFSKKSYAMIVLPLLYFMYQFILRLWMGQVQEYEIPRLHTDIQGFGSINSAYYAGYTLLQIPVAIFLSRHRVQWVLFFFSALASVFFIGGLLTTSLSIAVLCRFFVGAGSAAGVLALSKIVSLWIPNKKYGTVFGFCISLALLGLPLGQAPVKALVEKNGAFFVGMIIGSLGLLLSFLVAAYVREPQISNKTQHQSGLLKLTDLRYVLKSLPLWIIGVVSLLLVGTLEGLADVWGQSFLVDFYTMDKKNAAFLMSFCLFGVIGGMTLIPALGERIGHFLSVLFCTLGLTLSSFLFIMYSLNVYVLGMVSFSLGIFSGYQTSLFALGKKYAPKTINSEIVVAFINCINMAGGSFFHLAIPFVMNFFWAQKASLHLGENLQKIGLETLEKAPLYTVDMYQKGLLVVPLCAITGGIMFLYFLRKERQ